MSYVEVSLPEVARDLALVAELEGKVAAIAAIEFPGKDGEAETFEGEAANYVRKLLHNAATLSGGQTLPFEAASLMSQALTKISSSDLYDQLNDAVKTARGMGCFNNVELLRLTAKDGSVCEIVIAMRGEVNPYAPHNAYKLQEAYCIGRGAPTQERLLTYEDVWQHRYNILRDLLRYDKKIASISIAVVATLAVLAAVATALITTGVIPTLILFVLGVFLGGCVFHREIKILCGLDHNTALRMKEFLKRFPKGEMKAAT